MSTTPSQLSRPSSNQTGLRRPSDRYDLRSAFSPSIHLLLPPSRLEAPTTPPRFSMRTTAKQAYICRDCGYIYSDKTPFDKLPDKYFCPVCGAPKRRSRAYDPPAAKNTNATDVRKARRQTKPLGTPYRLP